MGVQIRLAEVSDAKAINDIYNYYVTHSTCTLQKDETTLDERVGWINAHDEKTPVLVVTKDNEVVGWGCLSNFRERWGYRFTVEDSIYVHPEQRRQKIGQMLLEALIERANQLHYHCIMAIIVTDHTGSLELHRRLGFTLVGTMREVGHKFGKWVDLSIMQKII